VPVHDLRNVIGCHVPVQGPVGINENDRTALALAEATAARKLVVDDGAPFDLLEQCLIYEPPGSGLAGSERMPHGPILNTDKYALPSQHESSRKQRSYRGAFGSTFL
jgi:hypothetical protein